MVFLLKQSGLRHEVLARMWGSWESHISLAGMEMVELLWKMFGSCYPSYRIPLVGIYPGEMKTHAHTKTCRQVLTAALFITVKN